MKEGLTKDRLWNSNYCRVMTANFALFFAFYLLTPLLPLYLVERFDATKDVVGLVLSGYTLTALLARPFSGFLVDTFPRKRVLMICFALFFVFFGGYLGASSLLLFTIVRTLHGAPFGALTVANTTVAIDVLPSSRRNEGIGYYGLGNNLAMAAAPTVAIYLYNLTGNFDLLFWLALVIAGLGMAAVSHLPSLPKEEAPQTGPLLRLDRFFLVRGWLLACNMVFFGFCFGVVSNYLAIYSRDVMGITGGTGTWFLLVSLSLIASRLQGAKALREGRLLMNAAVGTVFSSFAYTIFVLFPNAFGYYGSAILLGLGNGHLWPAFQNMMISMAHHNERGTANSTLLISWDVGIGLGVLAGGFLAEHFGYTTAFCAVAVAQLAGTALFFLFTRASYLAHQL
ncbi:MAG: MFS transporter [Bacteroidaceae bacterium]|nr:MFS transporter [Bacteroidaceae bacterium]